MQQVSADNSTSRCRRICLTPSRNEAWIINHFIASAKCWADDIIIADQGSTDGTLEQLQRDPEVALVINKSDFDEVHRQRLLIERARQIAGKRVLIALDVDEALSANCDRSREWDRVGHAEPGTVLRFRWVNVLPGFKEAWIPAEPVPFGFVDDGTYHSGKRIHNRRVPCPEGAPTIDLCDVVVLHFQYLSWERMMSKHRWYQAWEYSAHKQKTALQIFREYHHMYGSWDESEIHPMKSEWLEGYDRAGIDFRSLKSEPVTWWDREVLRMLRENGPEHFRKIALWDKDWNALAHQLGQNGVDLSDPRSVRERVLHRLLKVTQGRRANWGTRVLERWLQAAGW